MRDKKEMSVKIFWGSNVSDLEDQINDFICEDREVKDIKFCSATDEDGEDCLYAMIMYY